MLPQANGIQVVSALDLKSQPDKTYYIDKEKHIVRGNIDDYLKAVEQSVYLALSTERYDYIMFSHNYGIELKDLYGKDKRYVIPMLMQRIPEALMQDDRISGITDFGCTVNGGKYLASFTVKTEYGDLKVKEAELNV